MELQTKFVAAEQTQPHALTNSGLDVREPSYARPKSSHFLTDSDLFNHILDSKLIMVGLRFLSHFTTSKVGTILMVVVICCSLLSCIARGEGGGMDPNRQCIHIEQQTLRLDQLF
jgi:hypothetical protein